MRWLCALALSVWCVAWAEGTQETDPGVEAFVAGAEQVLEGAAAAEEPVAGVGPDRAPVVLTAERCAARAIENNAQAFIAAAKVAAARARVGQAGAARWPQVGVRAGYQYADGADIDLGGLGGVFGVDDIDKTTRTIEANVTQVLYAGGQIRAALRASRHLARSEAWQRDVALDVLALEARQAFYDALLAKALERVAADSVVAFERHLADAQHAFDVGLIGTFEVLRAKTELGARERDKIAARNAESLALVNLRRLLALPQDTPVVFEGELAWDPVETPVEALVEEALASRPELRALEEAAGAAAENVRRAKGEYKPNVAAEAKWSSVDGGAGLYPDGLSVSVGADWDVFTGGRRRHAMAEARADRERVAHEIDDVRRLVELDVRRAYIQVRNAIATIRRDRGTVELGREGQRLAELRFKEGVGTQAETLDAELALTQAETSLVQALRDYALAQAALRRALGRDTAERAQAATETQ